MKESELVWILRERAIHFKEFAIEAAERRWLDTSLYLTEQACQLLLKSSLLRLFAEETRTHSVRSLLALLVKKLNEISRSDLAENLSILSREYQDILIELDLAYTGAEYLVYRPDADTINRALEFMNKLFEIIEKVERNVLG